jgi:RluA family pseudouridine synthase
MQWNQPWPGSLAFFIDRLGLLKIGFVSLQIMVMINIIWNCDSAAVVYKPAGLPTQAPAPHESLETVLRQQFAERTSYVAFPHRLDRPVSGLILVAFTKRAARLLSEQFEARRISKRYLALVQGHVEGEGDLWIDHMSKVNDEARSEIVSDVDSRTFPDAKRAELQMKVIAHGDGVSLLELQPLTGRMHQLRLQTSSRGHAIVGDSLYGSQRTVAELSGCEIALQASKLEFNDPISGKRITVQAPSPPWV